MVSSFVVICDIGGEMNRIGREGLALTFEAPGAWLSGGRSISLSLGRVAAGVVVPRWRIEIFRRGKMGQKTFKARNASLPKARQPRIM